MILMSKLEDILSKLYTNSTYMLYFYIILGSITLLLIILIIIASKKNKKKAKEASLIAENKPSEEPVLETKTPLEVTPMVDANLTKNISEEEPVKAPEMPIMEEKTPEVSETIMPSFPEETPIMDKQAPFEVKNDLTKEEIFPEFIPDKPEMADIKPIFPEEEKEDIKPVLLDDNLPKEKTIYEVIKEEPKNTAADDLRARLDQVRKQKQEASLSQTSEMNNLMKSVGLDDTMVMPNLKSEESKLLGR